MVDHTWRDVVLRSASRPDFIYEHVTTDRDGLESMSYTHDVCVALMSCRDVCGWYVYL